MRPEPFDRCDNCGDPANAGDDRAWYIARFQTTEPTDHRLHIRGVLCDDCSHKLGHGEERNDRQRDMDSQPPDR